MKFILLILQQVQPKRKYRGKNLDTSEEESAYDAPEVPAAAIRNVVTRDGRPIAIPPMPQPIVAPDEAHFTKPISVPGYGIVTIDGPRFRVEELYNSKCLSGGPGCPVLVPSKGRYVEAKANVAGGWPFACVVVEPVEKELYRQHLGPNAVIIVLPKSADNIVGWTRDCTVQFSAQCGFEDIIMADDMVSDFYKLDGNKWQGARAVDCLRGLKNLGVPVAGLTAKMGNLHAKRALAYGSINFTKVFYLRVKVLRESSLAFSAHMRKTEDIAFLTVALKTLGPRQVVKVRNVCYKAFYSGTGGCEAVRRDKGRGFRGFCPLLNGLGDFDTMSPAQARYKEILEGLIELECLPQHHLPAKTRNKKEKRISVNPLAKYGMPMCIDSSGNYLYCLFANHSFQDSGRLEMVMPRNPYETKGGKNQKKDAEENVCSVSSPVLYKLDVRFDSSQWEKVCGSGDPIVEEKPHRENF